MDQSFDRHPEVQATTAFARVCDALWRALKDAGRRVLVVARIEIGLTNFGLSGSKSAKADLVGPLRGHLRVTALVFSFALLPLCAHAQTVEEKARVCAACHGENGVPVKKAFPVPVIWGQNLGYLFFQLRDFKSGARKSEAMAPIVEALERSDLMPLAQYFSKKPWPKLAQPHPPADVAALAQRANASVVCTSCHQDGFIGDSTQPRLAGQVGSYLDKTMADFRSGARGNNPSMTDLMKAITPADTAALATWLAAM